MEPKYPNENNNLCFLRQQTKRSQTMTNSTVTLYEMVPRLRPRDIMPNYLSPLMLFSPTLPDKLDSETNDLLDLSCLKSTTINDIPQKVHQKAKHSLNTSSITTSTNFSATQTLTPVLKKRDSILVRLEKKRRSTVA